MRLRQRTSKNVAARAADRDALQPWQNAKPLDFRISTAVLEAVCKSSWDFDENNFLHGDRTCDLRLLVKHANQYATLIVHRLS